MSDELFLTVHQAKANAPAEEGWYYARPWDQPDAPIIPRLVRYCPRLRTLQVMLFFGAGEAALDQFAWFGRVPICKELA